ncbi:MAG: DNA topoisomerase 3 [Parasporobacterium sp.]|nr:DNA topoisomerase 3 [Parasporobacterium sp.]
MGYRLALAEKPSVAQAIARVLGATKRCDGYLEGNGWLVSWCVGHLVELAEPESYDEKYSKWRYEDLPIFPEKWKYEVSSSTRKQFAIVKQLMNREDVTEIAECTDSGREGELIYRLVYHKCGCRKPFRRLWISSMEDAAIREGFANLRPSSEYDNLYEAALCRERADWIVGMNATRLFSCLYGQTLAVGRVMTPTLAMVVTRDAAIDAFKSEPFYTVRIIMDEINAEINAESERYSDKEEAAKLAALCKQAGTAAVQKVERKEKTEKPPSLYDLTSLQRDANRILGFTAQQTLDYTQSLYEKKLVTYPRTDSRYLTDDMASMIPGLVQDVAAVYGITEGLSVKPGQVINGNKVSDHHAIIPTKTMPKTDLSGLPSGEQAILQLISARLIAAVGEVHKYEETTVVFDCDGHLFTAKGKTVLEAGWKDAESRIRPVRNKEKNPADLPAIKTGDALPIARAEVHEGKTNPPRHFTEDTLLQAMEAASADEFPEEADRKGIGTPATRAATIEKLVQKGFVERRGDKKTKYLCATQKGTALITVMPEQIQSPSMTADWEEKLLRIEKGDYSPGSFMEDITGMVGSLVGTYEAAKEAEVLLPSRSVIGRCPHCGREVVERRKGWFCDNRDCRFALWKENAFFDSIGKKLTKGTAEKLLSSGKIRLTGCKSRRTGKTYDTTLFLETESDGKAKFRMDFGKGGGK